MNDQNAIERKDRNMSVKNKVYIEGCRGESRFWEKKNDEKG